MQSAKLVPVRVAHVGEMKHSGRPSPRTWRLLDGSATVGDSYVVELLQLLRRLALEANSAAVARSCRLTVDGLTHAERRAVMPVEQTTLSGLVRVLNGISGAKHLQDGDVEALILVSVQGETIYPGPGGQTSKRLAIASEPG